MPKRCRGRRRLSIPAIGLAFAVNTAVIVVLQLVALRMIERRRRTRMLVALAALWACSWAILGLAGAVPATPAASRLVVGAFGLFAVGETLLSPIGPAIINDVAPERLRGRYDAVGGIAFHLAAIAGPAIAGVLLGAGRGTAFIAMLIAGCALLATTALAREGVLPAYANGIAPGAVAAAPHRLRA